MNRWERNGLKPDYPSPRGLPGVLGKSHKAATAIGESTKEQEMTVRVYYNDNDPEACAWTRELIAAGLIPDGRVDERPIQEVQAADLVGYNRWHFFNGISGWELALQLAGWPDDKPVMCGSAPCQPFPSSP